MTSFLADIKTYSLRIREFSRADWTYYVLWVGLMLGLVFATGGFLAVGLYGGAAFPAEAWLVPIGAGIFTVAIAFDTIGHRTVYAEALDSGEGLVHSITIFLGIGSCVLLCLSYDYPHWFIIPAAVFTLLSFVYSLVDECFHWRRYINGDTDRVEAWSHVFILIGHAIMMTGWWTWLYLGYPGVAETLEFLSHPNGVSL